VRGNEEWRDSMYLDEIMMVLIISGMSQDDSKQIGGIPKMSELKILIRDINSDWNMKDKCKNYMEYNLKTLRCISPVLGGFEHWKKCSIAFVWCATYKQVLIMKLRSGFSQGGYSWTNDDDIAARIMLATFHWHPHR
jgi:hypothetical protein